MKENPRNYGRTPSDLIAENIKPVVIAIGSICLLFFILIICGYPVKVGPLEFNINELTKTDTFIVQEVDTLYIEDPNFRVKKNDPVPRRKDQTTKITRGDTIIEVSNQPVNINTGNNTGIIGNDNTVNVELKNVQRNLNDSSKKELIELIHGVMKSNNKDDKCTILVSSISDSEAMHFASEILSFLKSSGYNAQGIGSFQQFPQVIGVSVGFQFDRITVKVGAKPSH